MPERIHTVQKAQIQFRLVAELHALWECKENHTTLYHSQDNEMFEGCNRDLGDMLRLMLLEKNEDNFCIISGNADHSSTTTQAATEPANFLMLGSEIRLPEHLLYGPAVDKATSKESYAVELPT